MILDLYYINLPQGLQLFYLFFSALFRETERSALFHVEQPQEKGGPQPGPPKEGWKCFT